MTDSEFQRLVEEREIALLRMILATGKALAADTAHDWHGCQSRTGMTWNERTGDWEHTPMPDYMKEAFPNGL